MLTEDTLKEALQEADKSAAVCGRLCRVGSNIDGFTYLVWHNALGSSDSDKQRVHASGALSLAQPAFSDRLKSWLTRLHEHVRYDLNEGRALC